MEYSEKMVTNFGRFLEFNELLNCFELDETEYKLLFWRFFNNLTYEQIAVLYADLRDKKRISRQFIENKISRILAKIGRIAPSKKEKYKDSYFIDDSQKGLNNNRLSMFD